jgi:CheY-like chemotaxis protein
MVSEAMRLNPDVIVADISMPDITGIEAARQLRARVAGQSCFSHDSFGA